MLPPVARSSTSHVASALSPFMVATNCSVPFGPSVTKVGEIDAALAFLEVTLKLTEFDVVKTSPMGSPVCTNTSATTGFTSKAAGTTAESCVLLKKVETKKVLLPFMTHTARLES